MKKESFQDFGLQFGQRRKRLANFGVKRNYEVNFYVSMTHLLQVPRRVVSMCATTILLRHSKFACLHIFLLESKIVTQWKLCFLCYFCLFVLNFETDSFVHICSFRKLLLQDKQIVSSIDRSLWPWSIYMHWFSTPWKAQFWRFVFGNHQRTFHQKGKFTVTFKI